MSVSVRGRSEARGDPATSPAASEPAATGAGSPTGPGISASGESSTAADSGARGTSTASTTFDPADPGVSGAREDPGFRSLNNVEKFSDPQAGKIVSRWLGRFVLESGVVLPDLVVAYRHDGVPIGEGRQILVVHALTGSADAAGDWWAPLIGPGQTSRHGQVRRHLREPAGQPVRHERPHLAQPRSRASRYGRTFPHVTVRDQARAQWRLLDALGIGKLAVAVGGSLGGMVALEVALERPGEISRVVPIAAPARIGQLAVGWDHIQLEHDRQARHGGSGTGSPAGDDDISKRDRLRAALRRTRRAGRDAVDRELPAAPGPQAARAIRRGHVPDSRPGNGHARHRARPGRHRAPRSATLAAYGTRLTGVGIEGDILYGTNQVHEMVDVGDDGGHGRRLPRDPLDEGPRRVPGGVGPAAHDPGGRAEVRGRAGGGAARGAERPSDRGRAEGAGRGGRGPGRERRRGGAARAVLMG